MRLVKERKIMESFGLVDFSSQRSTNLGRRKGRVLDKQIIFNENSTQARSQSLGFESRL